MKDWVLIADVHLNLDRVVIAERSRDHLTLRFGTDSAFDPFILGGEDAERVWQMLSQRSVEILRKAPKKDPDFKRPQGFRKDAEDESRK